MCLGSRELAAYVLLIYLCPCSRNEFKLYLKRPDTKQEFVSQWQSSYNSLPGHLRREDLMKAELHQRVDVSVWKCVGVGVGVVMVCGWCL